MFQDFVAVAAVTTLVLLPLVWRVWRDHAEQRALMVRADVDSAVRHALGGESFVAVEVTPRVLGRPGQVVLSTPAGWDELVQLALPDVLERVPTKYEIVVRPGPRSAAPECEGRTAAAAA